MIVVSLESDAAPETLAIAAAAAKCFPLIAAPALAAALAAPPPKELWAAIPATLSPSSPSSESAVALAADAAVSALNTGADCAIIDLRYITVSPSTPLSDAFAPLRSIPRARLGLWIRSDSVQSLLPAAAEVAALLLIDARGSNTMITISAVADALAAPSNSNNSNASNPPRIAIAHDGADIQSPAFTFDRIVDAANLSLSPLMETDSSTHHQVDLAQAVANQLKSDRPDGLFSTIVTDEHGIALGLCYSSVESIRAALVSGQGVYMSRSRGLWHKGLTSGATQSLVRISWDCDGDALCFTVVQRAPGFCHLNTRTCFGPDSGITRLAEELVERRNAAPSGSYTKRLFDDPSLLHAKILEEADELCDATTPNDVAWETADLIYFALVKCVASGVSLADVERHLDIRSKKITRRAGDAKPKYAGVATAVTTTAASPAPTSVHAVAPAVDAQPFTMRHYTKSQLSAQEMNNLLKRPIIKTDEILARVRPIVDSVRKGGDVAVAEFTAKFDRVDLAPNQLVDRAPFDPAKMVLDPAVRQAIDMAYDNVWKFHDAQMDRETLVVETMPGVVCTRVARPVERVGLYVPGGTAVLPSTTLMLGVPAKVAGCSEIVIATPPRADGTIAPEIVYVASKIGATAILKAGGAQAVAALAYGTETVPKVDKIFGPGNQYVTAAKMVAQSDSSALVSIDMPAGPSELLVIADTTADLRYVVADLLSQAEHGVDSQVVLVAVGFDTTRIDAFNTELRRQATTLPRADIIRISLSKSVILTVTTLDEAIDFSNAYAPEHLILNVSSPSSLVHRIHHAGSIFLGPFSPESCGDYASGTNHTLPTYGYARMYSGVNTHTFLKHITTQELSRDGLNGIGDCVAVLASVEGLDAHRNAVIVRLADIRK